jgi:hypothetical protein
MQMTHSVGSTGHISLQVRDQEGTTSKVRLTVDKSDASGTLSILTPAGGVSRQLALTHLKKTRDGTQLTCYVSGATATLSLEGDENPPELHVLARLFLPIFEAVYQIDPTEQERLRAWINALSIDILASS